MPHRLSSHMVCDESDTTVSSSTMPGHQPHIATVMVVLGMARDNPSGIDEDMVRILDEAIDDIWRKIQAQPDVYIMTRDEYSIFNYFQHRFIGDAVAVAARARYWDNKVPETGTMPLHHQITPPKWLQDYYEAMMERIWRDSSLPSGQYD